MRKRSTPEKRDANDKQEREPSWQIAPFPVRLGLPLRVSYLPFPLQRFLASFSLS